MTTTFDITNATTASVARQLAEEMALPPAATELLIRAGAGKRHEARKMACSAAATDYVLTIQKESEPDFNGDEMEAAIATIAISDFFGSGGPRGAGGPYGVTVRHIAFNQCGTGRKQARDGGAYSAAIAELCSGFFLEVRDGKIFCLNARNHGVEVGRFITNGAAIATAFLLHRAGVLGWQIDHVADREDQVAGWANVLESATCWTILNQIMGDELEVWNLNGLRTRAESTGDEFLVAAIDIAAGLVAEREKST
jgi:hypothetical protein